MTMIFPPLQQKFLPQVYEQHQNLPIILLRNVAMFIQAPRKTIEESLNGLRLGWLCIYTRSHTASSNANLFPVLPFWTSSLLPEVLCSVHSPEKQFPAPFCSGSVFSLVPAPQRMFTWMPPSCHLFEIRSLNLMWEREQYALAVDASGCLLLLPRRSAKSLCETLS